MTPLPPLAHRVEEDSDPPAPPELEEARRILSVPLRGLCITSLVALLLCFLAAIPSTFDFLFGDKTVWLAGWLLIPVVLLYGPLIVLARRARNPEYRASGYAACIVALFAALLPILPVSLALLYFAIRGLKALGSPEVLDARDALAELVPPLTREAAAMQAVKVPGRGFIACGFLSVLLGLIATFAFAAAAEAAMSRRRFLDFSGYFYYFCAAYIFLAAVLLMIPIIICGFRLKRGQGTGAGYTAAGVSIAALLLLPVSPAAWGLMASAIWTFVALSKRDLRKRHRYLPDEDDL